jgi:hypothetical protein
MPGNASLMHSQNCKVTPAPSEIASQFPPLNYVQIKKQKVTKMVVSRRTQWSGGGYCTTRDIDEMVFIVLLKNLNC